MDLLLNQSPVSACYRHSICTFYFLTPRTCEPRSIGPTFILVNLSSFRSVVQGTDLSVLVPGLCPRQHENDPRGNAEVNTHVFTVNKLTDMASDQIWRFKGGLQFIQSGLNVCWWNMVLNLCPCCGLKINPLYKKTSWVYFCLTWGASQPWELCLGNSQSLFQCKLKTDSFFFQTINWSWPLVHIQPQDKMCVSVFVWEQQMSSVHTTFCLPISLNPRPY